MTRRLSYAEIDARKDDVQSYVGDAVSARFNGVSVACAVTWTSEEQIPALAVDVTDNARPGQFADSAAVAFARQKAREIMPYDYVFVRAVRAP